MSSSLQVAIHSETSSNLHRHNNLGSTLSCYVGLRKSAAVGPCHVLCTPSPVTLFTLRTLPDLVTVDRRLGRCSVSDWAPCKQVFLAKGLFLCVMICGCMFGDETVREMFLYEKYDRNKHAVWNTSLQTLNFLVCLFLILVFLLLIAWLIMLTSLTVYLMRWMQQKQDQFRSTEWSLWLTRVIDSYQQLTIIAHLSSRDRRLGKSTLLYIVCGLIVRSLFGAMDALVSWSNSHKFHYLKRPIITSDYTEVWWYLAPG